MTKKPSVRRATGTLVLLFAVALVGAATALAVRSQPAHPRAARQSAATKLAARRLAPEIKTMLRGLPATLPLPAQLNASISRIAVQTGTDAASARATVRLVQTHLGPEDASLYAYVLSNGAPCFSLSGENGACANQGVVGGPLPGVFFGIAGGYPAWGSPTGVEIPPALDGLVSNEVAALALTVNGATRSLTGVNDSFFALLPGARQPWSVTLTATYVDGTRRSFTIPDPH